MLLYSDITVCVFFFLVFSLKPSIYHMGIYQGAIAYLTRKHIDGPI